MIPTLSYSQESWGSRSSVSAGDKQPLLPTHPPVPVTYAGERKDIEKNVPASSGIGLAPAKEKESHHPG